MTSLDHSTGTDDTASDDATTCPLCAETAPEPGDIYRHLMVSHRKSELSRVVLASADPQGSVTLRSADEPADEDPETLSNGLRI